MINYKLSAIRAWALNPENNHGVVGGMVAPKRYVHLKSLESVTMTVFGKTVFADVHNGLKMMSSWSVWVDTYG